MTEHDDNTVLTRVKQVPQNKEFTDPPSERTSEPVNIEILEQISDRSKSNGLPDIVSLGISVMNYRNSIKSRD